MSNRVSNEASSLRNKKKNLFSF